MKDPVTFTAALMARVETAQSDRRVEKGVVERLVPYELLEPEGYGPTFFRALWRVGDMHARRLAA